LGNITCLNLAGNALMDVQGIDKLYGLEVLDLSDNQIADFSCLVGLGKLPSLRELSVQGNPFLLKTPPGYENLGQSRMQLSSSSSMFEQEYRLLILSWFASSRASIQDLPILHGQPVSEREIPYIRAMYVHQKYIPSKATTTTATKIQKVTRKYVRKGKAKIQESANSMTIQQKGQQLKRKSATRRARQPINVAFTVHDVLDKLYQENRKAYPEAYETLTHRQDETEKGGVQEQKEAEQEEADEESPEDHFHEDNMDSNSVSFSDRQLMAKEDTVATSKMSEDLSSTTEKEPEPAPEEEESSSLVFNLDEENDKEEMRTEEGEKETRVVQVVSPAPSPEKFPRTPPKSNAVVEGTDDLALIESPSLVDTSMERQLRDAVSQLSISLMLDPDVIPAVAKKQQDGEGFDADPKQREWGPEVRGLAPGCQRQ